MFRILYIAYGTHTARQKVAVGDGSAEEVRRRALVLSLFVERVDQ